MDISVKKADDLTATGYVCPFSRFALTQKLIHPKTGRFLLPSVPIGIYEGC